MQLVSLASINDWDIICWHYFGNVPDSKQEKPYSQALDYSSSEIEHPQGLHYQYDEVQLSAMMAASQIFRNFQLDPATDPTTFIFGRKSLYDPASMDYAGSYKKTGNCFLPTTYRYGSRIKIDTSITEDKIIGPVIKRGVYEPNPYVPTPEIEYNWNQGYLQFDNEQVCMFTGFLHGEDRSLMFDNGVEVSRVEFRNPENIAYPVTGEEGYFEFTLTSLDKKAIDESEELLVSLVSTSFNSGFELDHSKIKREFLWNWNKKSTVNTGSTPVLVTRVGCNIKLPGIIKGDYLFYDFHFNLIGSGSFTRGEICIPCDKPVFFTLIKPK